MPSWQDGPPRKAIIEFVEAVTAEGSKDFVAPAERIAVFDNDGTLWSEQLMYFQVLFALAEVERLAPQHTEWKSQQPFKAVLEGDSLGANLLYGVAATGSELTIVDSNHHRHSGLIAGGREARDP